jgi:putative transposase
MARLPRWVVPGLTHLVIQRGHSGLAVFTDALDQQAYVNAVHSAAASEAVKLHAWALLDTEVLLLLTPDTAPALSRFIQDLGRRYVSAYNRRHGHAGSIWAGRFCCAPLEPGAQRLFALRWVDGAGVTDATSSAHHRLGGPRDALLTDPPEFWQLGNTPFEREAAYRQLLAQGLAAGTAAALRRAAVAGRALGTPTFITGLGAAAQQRQMARPRGRPRRAPA